MQDNQITNSPNISEISALPDAGRIVALDLGAKKVGVAVSDELQITARPLSTVERRSWKELLKKISAIIEEFDAAALVIGLPYNFDGSENEMSQEARRLARNFSLSLSVPVFLQDERLTSKFARQNLHDQGFKELEILRRIDAEAAMLILSDFLALKEELKQRGKANRDTQDKQDKKDNSI